MKINSKKLDSSLIFVGDIAVPDFIHAEQFRRVLELHQDIFDSKLVVCNFEGPIFTGEMKDTKRSLLYNHHSVPGIIKSYSRPVFCLANNHLNDFPSSFTETIETLKKEGIPYCGAGTTKSEADSPTCIENNNKKRIFIINSCWDFLLYNRKNPAEGVYVSEIHEIKLLEKVRELKAIEPDSFIVLYFHWSLDLEILPYPMYRKFSMALIDEGANVVVGSHSHCIQGGEKYKNGYIVYSLGNFYIPDNSFIGGKLSYPELSRIQLALEWNPESNKATCHWFESRAIGSLHNLIYLGKDAFESDQRLKRYSPFTTMDDKQYLEFFRKERRKRFLIPIYIDFERRRKNKLLTFGLKNRARIAHQLARMNIIKWQR